MQLAILDDYQNVVLSMADWSNLESRVDITVYNDHLASPDKLVERLKPYDIIVCIRERTKFPRELLIQLPNLKLLVTGGMRNFGIDMKAAREFGITVCGTKSIGYPTAELTWALLLSTIRNIPKEVCSIWNGGWQVGLGECCYGKVLGIIGLGRVGSQIAKFANAFGMNVLAWSHNLTEDRCKELGVKYAGSLEKLLSLSDIVTIHVVHSERTHGLIGYREFVSMKPTAYLINTSRGAIVHEKSLIEAIINKEIAGAGIDVYDIEPLPDNHQLRNLDRVVTTPHLGYTCKENYQVYFEQGIENIEAWLDGNPIRVLN